ncbi:MAG: hypothetical protein AB7T06_08455 [Kofleriaceae bacterium]
MPPRANLWCRRAVPACLVDNCVATFGGVSGQLTCIANNTGVPVI